MTTDSYECLNCHTWSHYAQPLPHEAMTDAEPNWCPYCGHESLRWRTSDNWELIEVWAGAPKVAT